MDAIEIVWTPATLERADRAKDVLPVNSLLEAAKNDPDVVIWRFALPKADISYVRYILEAHEGLAQMCSHKGQEEIYWIVPRSCRIPAEALAVQLAKEVNMRPLVETKQGTSLGVQDHNLHPTG